MEPIDVNYESPLGKKIIVSNKTKLKMKLFLIILLFILLVFVINYIPLFGWSFAFVDYMPGISVFKQPFVGFKYFKEIFSSTSDFPIVIRNTLVNGSLGILVSPLPVIFAILLGQLKSNKF